MTLPPDGMGPVKIPANLPELVRSAFNRARASGDVHFFPTQVTLVNVNSVPFQLRFSPALANKPSGPQPPAPSTDSVPTFSSPSLKEAEPKKPTPKPFFDPFDNPPPTMLVTPLAPSHNLVLNKFAIVPEHFILATQSFKEQTHLLEPADLQASYACIEAYHAHTPTTTDPTSTSTERDTNTDGLGNRDTTTKEGEERERELYVFFNSGPASGSSQPHRHIQMLPVARMREGLGRDEAVAWEVLAGTLVDDEVRRRLPFSAFVERIGPGVDLGTVYLRLYRRACEAVLGVDGADGVADGQGVEGVEARVDYNLAMTREVMVIAPRVGEGAAVTVPGEGCSRKEVGKLALNGTVLAGTALVKTQAEWDALREDPEQLVEILGRIGVPKVKVPPPV